MNLMTYSVGDQPNDSIVPQKMLDQQEVGHMRHSEGIKCEN